MPPIPSDSCGICQGDPLRRRYVDEQLSLGTPHTTIEKTARSLGIPVKRETIRRHVRVCVSRGVQNAFPDPEQSTANSQSVPVNLELDDPKHNKDFATLVRAEAVRRLQNGELKVSTQDGLNAQAMIDRREEKKKTNDILITIGRWLSGQTAPPAPMLEAENPIEGEFEIVEDVTNALTAG